MEEYEPDELVRCYLVMYDDNTLRKPKFHAYTLDKDILKWYLKFFNTDHFSVKVIEDRFDRIREMVINHDDSYAKKISLVNLITRDDDSKNDNIRVVQIPMTGEDQQHVEAYCKGVSLRDDNTYQYLLTRIPAFKQEYIDALDDILLVKMCNALTYNGDEELKELLTVDELRIAVKVLSNLFK